MVIEFNTELELDDTRLDRSDSERYWPLCPPPAPYVRDVVFCRLLRDFWAMGMERGSVVTSGFADDPFNT